MDGAVETLCEDILRKNESEKKIEIDCVTLRDKEARKNFNKYPSTHFYELNFCVGNFADHFIRCVNYISRKLFGINFRKAIREKQYEENMSFNEYDLIVFEGVNPFITEKITQKIGKEKMVLHLHRVTEATEEMSKVFGYFIGISNYVSNAFCKNGIVSPDRVYTVMNGINLEKFNIEMNDAEKLSLKEKCGIKQDETVFIYTGRLLEEKGVRELIKAFKMMPEKSKCRLIIVGSTFSGSSKQTKYSEELKEIAKGENVVFTGYIPNGELYKYYSISDVAVFPTISEEGFGLVAVEAMSKKLPLIVTNSGGMKEIVTDKCGLKVDIVEDLVKNLSKKMSMLAKDKELRKRMGEEGYIESQKYSDRNYYNDFVDALEKIEKASIK